MAVLSNFFAAINQIAAERGIETDEVLEAIKAAMLTGFRKDYDLGESLTINIDKEKGTIEVYADKKVVKKVTNSATQIYLDDAKKIEPKLKTGDHVTVDITPEGNFGRIAVQAAKQVILQKIREAEKESIMKDFKDKIGTMESGIIQRMDKNNVIVEIRKAFAIMPPEERLPNEFYKSGARLKFLLKEIQQSAKGKQLIVSRADPKFLDELFTLEVPEIRSGSIEIKAIAREAGSRSKVAVVSSSEGVDPIGACVGQRGIRISNVTDELKGEKIDIILWDEKLETFIANSLSPAQVKTIEIDGKKAIATVIVPDDQLSLAIGKDGQNVRLAAKLTGWKINIESENKEDDKPTPEEKTDKDKPATKGKKAVKKKSKVKKTKAAKKKSQTKTKKKTKKKVAAKKTAVKKKKVKKTKAAKKKSLAKPKKESKKKTAAKKTK